MKVIIFGTGKLYRSGRYNFSDMEIVAFADNDPAKWGTYLDGVPIISPDRISDYQYDYILLVTVYYKEIYEQLLQLGIAEETIIDREHPRILGARSVMKYEIPKADKTGRRILLVTHDLALTGAPLMLYNMAEILVRQGYRVELYSPRRGRLLYEFIKKGVSVSIFDGFAFDQQELKYYFGQYDMILVNTVVLHELVASLDLLHIPIVWWLHEEDDIYESYQIDLTGYDLQNVSVYGVSNRTIQSYCKYSGGKKIDKLVYGIAENNYAGKAKTKKEKVVFAMIGTVDRRKAQDVFADAIEAYWDTWKDHAEFWMIGKISDADRLKYGASGKVKIWGILEQSELMRLYSDIDVVVCPSRNDPLPVVLTEAMMNRKVCIASDMTGTAEYVKPYQNGLICKAGDAESLASAMQWVMQHRECLEEIGDRAYQIYEQNFSMQQFERNVLSIAARCLNRQEEE